MVRGTAKEKLIALVLAASAWSTPLAQAAASAGADPADLSDSELGGAIAAAAREPQPQYCAKLVPLMTEAASRRPEPMLRAAKAEADLFCALDQKRWEDAYRHLLDAEAMSGRQGHFGAWGAQLAMWAGQPADAAKRLVSFAEAEQPDQLLSLDLESLSWTIWELRRLKRGEDRARVIRALTSSKHYERMPFEIRRFLSGVLLDVDFATIDLAQARARLADVDNPGTLIGFLGERRYERLWPEIERRSGPNLQRAVADHLARARAAAAAKPTDPMLRQELVHALYFATRYDEAIALARGIDHAPEKVTSLTEHDGWAINIEAHALDALGRSDEARAAFDLLASIPYDPSRTDWLVNFVINRASRFVDRGEWEAGLAANSLADQIAAQSGTPYAKLLVLRNRVCALMGLGRPAEAKQALVQVETQRADSYSVAAEAMLCANEEDRAATIVKEALADPFAAPAMVESLQGLDFDLFVLGTEQLQIRRRLRNRPDVSAAFAAIARDIPAAYIPDVARKRPIKLREQDFSAGQDGAMR